MNIEHLDRAARLRDELAQLLDTLAWLGTTPPLGARFYVDHDGFVGTVIGHYTRLDGRRGVVMQQEGTLIVHVYGEKWLLPVAGEHATTAPPTRQRRAQRMAIPPAPHPEPVEGRTP